MRYSNAAAKSDIDYDQYLRDTKFVAACFLTRE